MNARSTADRSPIRRRTDPCSESIGKFIELDLPHNEREDGLHDVLVPGVHLKAVDFEKDERREDCDSLIAIEERMVAGQAIPRSAAAFVSIVG
jgi:hypothetical protein